MINLIIKTFLKGKTIIGLITRHVTMYLCFFMSSSLMDKITYASTKALLDPGRFAVGIVVDNELHLNPLHGILHVKPSFPYLDKSDKALKDDEPTGNFFMSIALLKDVNVFCVNLLRVG